MTETPLRIALLTYRGNPRSGGQGVYVKLLSQELAAMGHRVDVWSGPPYPELADHIRLIKVPSLDLWQGDKLRKVPTFREMRDPINRLEYVRTMMGEFPEMKTFLRRVDREFLAVGPNGGGYDIVHDNQCLGDALLTMRRRVPVIATIHHPITKDYKIEMKSAPFYAIKKRWGLWRWYSFLDMQMEVSRQLDRVLTVSEASAADIHSEYGIDQDRLRVVGIGIDTEIFRPIAGVVRNKSQLITTLSADVPLKGLHYLLEALAILRRDRPDIHLKIIGRVRPRSGTKAKIRRLGLESALTFSGKVPAEEIARTYAESSVAVVASLYEGFGLPAGEAMACETPLVSTTGGALPEVVGRDGTAGLLVAPRDPGALADGIRELLDAPEERRIAMGKAARARVLELFTWRRAAERTVDNYRELIAARAAERC
jgi:glycosyltransferase involved in cell wall biosynthesis